MITTVNIAALMALKKEVKKKKKAKSISGFDTALLALGITELKHRENEKK